MYFVQCDYGISSDEVDFDLIAKELQIKPTRFWKRGEKYNTPRGVYRRGNSVWALSSSGTVSKNLDCLLDNLKELETILKPKWDILKKYKKDTLLFCGLWIDIMSNNKSCFGFDLCSPRLDFFGSITNEIHVAFYANDDFRGEAKLFHNGEMYRKIFERYNIMSDENFFVERKSFSKEELFTIKKEMKRRCDK